MNEWKNVWEKRPGSVETTEDVFDMFCKLKAADGFDVQTSENYYPEMLQQWKDMNEAIKNGVKTPVRSVYEVGCGSGVNLYLFHQLAGMESLGGMDYSESLVRLAKQVLNTADIICDEAIRLRESPKYDLVLSDSVFQYFYDEAYGMKVLEKMYQKAEQAVVITEIHDAARREEHLEYRRSLVEDYDEKYKGLDKTYYSKEAFAEFAEQHGCRYEFLKPKNDAYWNNEFVFDFYLYL